MLSDVEIREIRTFLVVADELHFRRAADRLGVTPSRVSQTIRLLETRIGGRLLDRSSRRARLTSLGEQLARDLRPAQRQVDRALAAAHDAATGIAGTLRLGMYLPTNGGPHLVEIVRAFEAEHPNCKVTLIDTGFERDQLDWLRTDDAELLAARLPLTEPDIAVGPILSTEERVVAVSTDHPFAKRDAVSFEELAEYPVSDLPTLPREMMDVFIPPRTPSGRLLRRVPAPAPAHLLVRVALGELIHPTVPTFLEHYSQPGVVSVPITGLRPSQTALIWLGSSQNPKIAAFARTAEMVLASKQAPALVSTLRTAPTAGP
jgi:DNA-binding transcriptional LysR family regulator